MRKLNTITSLFFLLCAALTGCTQQEENPSIQNTDLVNVAIHLGSSTTRSYTDTEGTVKKLRVLVFNKKTDNTYEFEKQKMWTDFTNENNDENTIQISSGAKRFYFFANDDMADFRLHSTGAAYNFDDGATATYTEDELKDIVIHQFEYKGTLTYTAADLLPMTAMTEQSINRMNGQYVYTTLTIAVAQVTLKMKLNAPLTTGATLKLVYARIGNNPTNEYFFPQYEPKTGSETTGKVKLPSYDASDYNNSAVYTPADYVDITTAEQEIANFYVHENPYGKGGTQDGSTLDDHTTGYQGSSSKLNLFYEYTMGTDHFQKGVLKDLPYLVRNGKLEITATVTPPSNTSETYSIIVQVETQWIQKTEDVPTFE
ncbi:fimbrial protein [Bacteroides helcogenes]|uniref:Major fimbrial subunit protein N-terminal domain-containing protein n=1 Tax=Bacteroides helcogenes (strain ATCC 35417 / DSM 20613 / JCM 6297 / CCUG 15421 / P 36-108) TaxID=693979 RepID=E6SNE7_BACT6|nr:fimbrial protein [Bacteroides helcogenes]ADV42740.1 hypothetical protein Bache_0717 [Bacteroides helcogenes P 36-108]MDY5239571.1 hypothetical protein [Bacteroides helcogenes]